MSRNNYVSHFLLFFVFLFTTVSWGIICWVFNIYTYAESIYFALDKVPGHFFSPGIILTSVLCLLLLFLYAFSLFLLKKYFYDLRLLVVFLAATTVISGTFALFTYPVGALDLFNYVLIGKLVIFYQQNPYIIPFDAVGLLDPLHKYAIFLNVTTGYGPWWILITSFVLFLTGTSHILPMILGYKLLSFLCIMATGFFLYSIQKDKQLKLLAAGMYVLNPYVIFDGIVNAHNDIFVAFFLVIAWWAYTKKLVNVLLLVVLAGLIKVYALSVFPLFLFMMLRDKWYLKDVVMALLLASIGFVLLFLPFWSSGQVVSGVLKGLHDAQVINGFSIFSLTREYLFSFHVSQSWLMVSQYVFYLVFLTIFVAVCFSFRRARDYVPQMIVILLAFFLCITILQPWYLIVVLSLIAVIPTKKNIVGSTVISAGAFLSYSASIWGWFHSGFTIFTIHLFLSLFVTMPAFMCLIYLLYTKSSTKN